LRLQVEDNAEKEEAALRETHNDKIKKLQKQLDDQLAAEEAKIRQVFILSLSGSRFFGRGTLKCWFLLSSCQIDVFLPISVPRLR
jgi:phage-related minor tail protein